MSTIFNDWCATHGVGHDAPVIPQDFPITGNERTREPSCLIFALDVHFVLCRPWNGSTPPHRGWRSRDERSASMFDGMVRFIVLSLRQFSSLCVAYLD